MLFSYMLCVFVYSVSMLGMHFELAFTLTAVGGYCFLDNLFFSSSTSCVLLCGRSLLVLVWIDELVWYRIDRDYRFNPNELQYW